MPSLAPSHRTKARLAVVTLTLTLTLTVCLAPVAGAAAPPSVEDALRLTPIQDDVAYDQPDRGAFADCRVQAVQEAGLAGWEVVGPAGQTVRRYLDTNADSRLDQWCYYQNGIEVYRDVDGNFNRKADQYRWLGTAGIRWGLDPNEDGTIDSWKVISAEEVTAEVVAAVREQDAARFARLLLTERELEGLALGDEQQEALAAKLATARRDFPALARRQEVITDQTEWVYFGGGQPGVVPAGTAGAGRDLYVYDNAAAIVETAGESRQIGIGTLIRVGDVWRIVDLPQQLVTDEEMAGTGFFFQASLNERTDAPAATGLSPTLQRLVEQLEDVDEQLATESDLEAMARLHGRRADLLEQLGEQAETAAEKSTWLRQLADSVSAAVQTGAYPQGVQRLEALRDQLEDGDAEDRAYVEFRLLSADYGAKIQDPDADFSAIQEAWLENLESFVETYPRSEDAPEAMLQLAIASEFAGEDDDALQWFGRIEERFPNHPLARKAAGAQARLNSVGRTLSFRGNTIDGQQVNTAAFRGRTVVVHYWASWCEPCKQDILVLQQLKRRYGDRLEVVGINVDSETAVARAAVRELGLTWPQMHEPGGLDSRPAVEFGVLTLPTTVLLDRQGKVVSRNVHGGELDSELRKLIQ